MGLKLTTRLSRRRWNALSAEPLVGLKLEDGPQRGVRGGLSAEPLVGLKHRLRRANGHQAPFSRTPRGFEASNTTQPK